MCLHIVGLRHTISCYDTHFCRRIIYVVWRLTSHHCVLFRTIKGDISRHLLFYSHIVFAMQSLHDWSNSQNIRWHDSNKKAASNSWLTTFVKSQKASYCLCLMAVMFCVDANRWDGAKFYQASSTPYKIREDVFSSNFCSACTLEKIFRFLAFS